MVFWIKQLYAEFGLVVLSFMLCACIIYQISWAIFHVVGANPKMKSNIGSIDMLPITLLITYSYVSMVPNHDLPVEI